MRSSIRCGRRAKVRNLVTRSAVNRSQSSSPWPAGPVLEIPVSLFSVVATTAPTRELVTHGIVLVLRSTLGLSLWNQLPFLPRAPAYLGAKYHTLCRAEGEGGEGLNGETCLFLSRHAGSRHGQCYCWRARARARRP